MRTSRVAALAGAVSILACGSARAAPPPDPGYSYFASDGGYLTTGSGGGAASTLTAGYGYRFDRHYAIEGGYSGILDQGISAHGGYVDGFGFLPLGPHSRVSLFSTVGASYISSVYLGSTGYAASAFGVRAGGGIEWRFSDTWAIRGAVRYQTIVTSAVVTSVGFTVRF